MVGILAQILRYYQSSLSMLEDWQYACIYMNIPKCLKTFSTKIIFWFSLSDWCTQRICNWWWLQCPYGKSTSVGAVGATSCTDCKVGTYYEQPLCKNVRFNAYQWNVDGLNDTQHVLFSYYTHLMIVKLWSCHWHKFCVSCNRDSFIKLYYTESSQLLLNCF